MVTGHCAGARIDDSTNSVGFTDDGYESESVRNTHSMVS